MLEWTEKQIVVQSEIPKTCALLEELGFKKRLFKKHLWVLHSPINQSTAAVSKLMEVGVLFLNETQAKRASPAQIVQTKLSQGEVSGSALCLHNPGTGWLVFSYGQSTSAVQRRPSDQWIAREIDGRWGYSNAAGEAVVPAKFEKTLPFSEGLGRYKIGEKWGYLNESGELVVAPRFGHAEAFAFGFAVVRSTGFFGYIFPSGEFLSEPVFDKALSFHGDLGEVWLSGTRWAITREGALVQKRWDTC